MDEWSIDGEISEEQGTPFPTPAPPPLVEGESGQYQLIEQLGEGGAGVVFRAVDPLGRAVALKLLSRVHDPRAVERFLREGRIAASLRHTNVVAIHEAGVFNGHPFLAYELVTGGGSFDEALQRLGVDGRLDLILQVCDGVAFAHRQGVVHRDLKPDNILVGEDGRPRVADFGLGLAEADHRLTLSGAMIGTPRYMSPEQAQGRSEDHGPASDVWSLGVILYEALTGGSPFKATSLAELVVEICDATPARPRRFDRSISPAVERVCLKALSTRPEDRYSDAGELARALIAARRSGGRKLLPAVVGSVLLVGAGIGLALGLGRGSSGPKKPKPPTTASGPSLPPLAPAIAEIERHIEAKRLRQALKDLEALRAHYPDEPLIWLTRADIFSTGKKWKDALESYTHASQLDPTSSRALTGRGICRAQQGENAKGLADLDRAIGLDPKNSDALEKRSLLNYRRRDYTAALADADRAVKLDPASAEARNARGLARAARKDYQGGILDLEEAIALDRDPTIISNLGAVLIQAKRTEEGLRYLEEAASLDPENHGTWNALGIAALNARQNERALSSFTRALKIKPDKPESLYARAVTLHRLGRDREAALDLRHLIEKHPDIPEANRARQMLIRLQGP